MKWNVLKCIKTSQKSIVSCAFCTQNTRAYAHSIMIITQCIFFSMSFFEKFLHYGIIKTTIIVEEFIQLFT